MRPNGPLFLIATSNVFFMIYIFWIHHNPNRNYQSYVNDTKPSSKTPKNKRDLSGFLGYSEKQHLKLQALVQRKAPALDEELVSFVKEVMDYPAPKNRIKMSRFLIKTPQVEEVENILKNKTGGFFVEAGGLDGERSSNTIWLEQKRDWSGLLVEPDPFYYTQLVGKNRHSWSINGGISPYNYMSEIPFDLRNDGSGQLNVKKDSSTKFKVPCYPLLTLLTAIGNTHVDYFSLDVEGAEGIILESLPFDKLDITTLSVEYSHGDKSKYLEIMEKKGYEKVKDINKYNIGISLWVDDFIFVKKGVL